MIRKYFLAVMCLLTLRTPQLFAQTCPTIPLSTTDRRQVWGRELTYTIDLDPSLASCLPQFERAANNWQNSGANRDFKAMFVFGGGGDDRIQVRKGDCGDAEREAGCFVPTAITGGLGGATIELDANHGDCTAFAQTFAHELGHGFGLGDYRGTSTNTIMRGATVINGGPIWATSNLLLGPTACDATRVQNTWAVPLLSEQCGQPISGCLSTQAFNVIECRCVEAVANEPGSGVESSEVKPIDPLLIDVAGDGVDLTDIPTGVRFNIAGTGLRNVAWTRLGSDDGWLALDRNHNGRIDDGGELFGDWTPQAPSEEPNGFLALAELDRPANGGNGNGFMDAGDTVFTSLRIWQDLDHDGETDLGELRRLGDVGIREIGLDYRSSSRHDQYGNFLRYRAKVHSTKGSSVGGWAYDAFVLYLP